MIPNTEALLPKNGGIGGRPGMGGMGGSIPPAWMKTMSARRPTMASCSSVSRPPPHLQQHLLKEETQYTQSVL